MNKLAEVMNRRVPEQGSHRGSDTEVHRRKKENRKLQLELRAEKQKLNSTIIKYQREMTDMQAVGKPTCSAVPLAANSTTFDLQLLAEENQVRLELQMALDSKESDIEQLRCQLSTLSVHSLDSTSISSGNDLDASEAYPGMQADLWVCSQLLSRWPSSFLPVPLFSLLLGFQDDCFHWFLTLILYPLLPLSLPPLSSAVRCSAHYSLPHLRIYVLHLPAHTQIRLHRHAAPPALGSL